MRKGPEKGTRKVDMPFCVLYNGYYRDKKPSSFISNVLGCDMSTVLRRLKSMGFPVRGSNDTKRGKPPKNKIDIPIDDIVSFYSNDYVSVEDVAKKFKVSRQVIDRILKENGIPKKPMHLSRNYKKDNHPNWNPLKTEKERVEGRYDPNLKFWRSEVLRRDGYKCVKCGDDKGGNLNSHHIQPYWKFPHLRTSIENGATLCEACHRKFHETYGWKHFSKDDFLEYIK